MKAVFSCIIVLVMAAALGLMVQADDQPAKTTGKGTSFDKIKSLAGEWEVTKGPPDHGHQGATVTYKVTAGGSAVEETMFGGTDHEMITLYYMDGGDLALTHYCILQNRPKMRATRQSPTDTIQLICQEKDNPGLNAEDHMHQVTITLIDASHLKSEWVLYKGGKSESSHAFELTRKAFKAVR